MHDAHRPRKLQLDREQILRDLWQRPRSIIQLEHEQLKHGDVFGGGATHEEVR